jgi:hypothetical protein
MNVNDKLTKLYKPMDDYVFSYIIPTIFIFTMLFTILTMYLKAEILESKLDWANTKCIPKYMFISGFLHKEPGINALSSTLDNFYQCVAQFKPKRYYISPISKIEMSPENIKTIDTYNKIRLAIGSQKSDNTTTIDYMTQYITRFKTIFVVSDSFIDNATPDEIKAMNTLLNNYIKIRKARGITTTEMDGTGTASMMDYVSTYKTNTGMTDEEIGNATSDDIKNKLTSLGIN